MGKTKTSKNRFETDFGKERPHYVHAGFTDMNSITTGLSLNVEKLLPVGFPLELLERPAPPAQWMFRVDSYRAPPLKMTLETIEEDTPEFERGDYIKRSKSLPLQRRFSMDGMSGLHRMPRYLPSQEGSNAEDGTGYFAGQGYLKGENGYGVSVSGPILSNHKDYTPRKRRKSRISMTRMREAVRHILSRMRPASRKSHWRSRRCRAMYSNRRT